MEPAISVHGLRKRFGRIDALDGLSFEVPVGSLFGFLGPNGAGKTTTIRILAGLIPTDSGETVILGRETPSGLAKIAHRLGFLLEGSGFYPRLSAEDNLRTLARMTGDLKAASRTSGLLDLVGLSSRARDAVQGFSQGMRQRLGLAASLLHDPEVLILDEPMNGLDPPGRKDIRGVLSEICRQGKTIFLSSHLLTELEELCDLVAIVKSGRLVAQGSLESLLAGSIVRVVVDQQEHAKRTLQNSGWNVSESGHALLVEGGAPAEINSRLVHAGLSPSEIGPLKKSLEDVFMEVAGDSGDQ